MSNGNISCFNVYINVCVMYCIFSFWCQTLIDLNISYGSLGTGSSENHIILANDLVVYPCLPLFWHPFIPALVNSVNHSVSNNSFSALVFLWRRFSIFWKVFTDQVKTWWPSLTFRCNSEYHLWGFCCSLSVPEYFQSLNKQQPSVLARNVSCAW